MKDMTNSFTRPSQKKEMGEISTISTKKMSHSDWLLERRKGIGGSDVGSILGFNRFSSPTKVFYEKISQTEPHEEDNNKMWFGRELEEAVAKRFEMEEGKKVRRSEAMIFNSDYPYSFANIDRKVVGEDAILECKTTSYYNLKDMDEGNPPQSYYLQCMHYLAVTGKKKCYLAIVYLNHGMEYRCLEIVRDEDEINWLMDQEKFFWEEYVEKQVLPPDDGSNVTKECIGKMCLNGEINDTAVMDLSNLKQDLDTLDFVKREIKGLEEQKNVLENKIKLEMMDFSKGESDDYKVSFKEQTRKTVDSTRLKKENPELFEEYSKSSKNRVLRITKKVGK